MSAATRALPPSGVPEFEPYWEGLRAGRLMLPKCDACGPFFYPRLVCPKCHGRVSSWVEASGRGTLYSFAIPQVPMQPQWTGGAPYILAMVELEEGPRLSTNLVDIAPDPSLIRVGMPVELKCEAVSEGVTLALFCPAAEGSQP